METKGECLQHIKDKTEFENYNSGSYTSASFCFCYSIDPCLSGCGYDVMSFGIIIYSDYIMLGKKWLCEWQVCTAMGLWTASKAITVWHASILLMDKREARQLIMVQGSWISASVYLFVCVQRSGMQEVPHSAHGRSYSFSAQAYT